MQPADEGAANSPAHAIMCRKHGCRDYCTNYASDTAIPAPARVSSYRRAAQPEEPTCHLPPRRSTRRYLRMARPMAGIDRRELLFGLACAAPFFSMAQASESKVEAALREFQNSPELAADNYGMREFAENFPILRLERAPSKVSPSPLKISDLAKRFIVAFEVSSEATYKAKYYRPIWPGGRSGVTIGIGYDLGYVRQDDFQKAWSVYLEKSRLEELAGTCGKTGIVAQEAVASVASIQVGWEIASKQFEDELQRYVALAQRSLPNFSSLSEHCRGALVSLVYNRGPSFDAGGDRYAEMRNIRAHMESKSVLRIPAELRAMARIWPEVKGLQRRRAAEADLFESGL